jgi:hypothetical protein
VVNGGPVMKQQARIVGKVTNVPVCMIACEPKAEVLRESLVAG